MENLRVFKNEEFGQVRTVTIDGEPWFVGKDVATALGYKDTSDALKVHVDDDDKYHVKVGEIPTLKTSNFGAYLINESGLYSLIFGSKLESAKKFRHWVFDEVLPSIHKHDNSNKQGGEKDMDMKLEKLQVINIEGVDCYEKDGTAYLKLETVARGLGFTQKKNGVEYIKWERVSGYLKELGFSPEVGKDSFIPENIFYRLAIKTKNETAEKFQAKVADEIIPSIRKTGGYISGQETLSDEELLAKAVLVAQNKIAERDEQIQEMQPKADYFDALVDKKLNTNIRDTSKELGIKEREFTKFLEDGGFIFRQGSNNLIRPYAQYTESGKGLFTMKDRHCKKTGWVGRQVFIMPKGKETFRLLLENR